MGTMCDAGNRVISEKDGGWRIERLSTGKSIAMRRTPGGNYISNMWMKKKKALGAHNPVEEMLEGEQRSLVGARQTF